MNEFQALQNLYSNFKKSINNKISDETLRKKKELNDTLYSSIEVFLKNNVENIAHEDFNNICKTARNYHFEIDAIIKRKLAENKLITKTRSKSISPKNILKTTVSVSQDTLSKRKAKSKAIPQQSINKESSTHNSKYNLRVVVLVIQFCLKLKTRINKNIEIIMPSVDIKLGTALVNTYDGSPEKLDSFLDAVTLFADTTEAEYASATAAQKEAAQVTLVRFVKTRLTGVARQVIGELNNLQEILDIIKLRCATKATSDSILAKLRAAKQTSSTENFCENLEKLTNDLKYAYITEKIPQDTAEKMSTKRGVEALINGLKNSDTKLILKAGNFEKFQDAIQKLQENVETTGNNAEMNQSSQRIFWSARGGSRGRGRFQHARGTRGSPRNYQSYNRGNFHNNRGNYPTRGHQYPRQRGNWSQRGSFNNPYGMFMTVQQPSQQNVPQQIQQLNALQMQQGYQQMSHNLPGPQQNFLGPQQGQFMQ